MALVTNSKYGTAVELAAGSAPSTDVGLYAKDGGGDNKHLVLQAHTASFTGDVHVTGTLHVEGTINSTSRNETNLIIEDKTITVASGSNAEGDVDGAGINFGASGDSAFASLLFEADNLGDSDHHLLSSTAFKANGEIHSTGDITVGDDLNLSSNSAVLNVGSDQPFALTHANANNTATVSTNHRLAFGNATDYIAGDGTDLLLVSAADVKVTGDLTPSADDTYDLGTATAAWQDLHLEGDIRMTDAGSVQTAAGDLTLKGVTAGVTIDAATTVKIDSAAGDISFEDAGTAKLALDMDGTAGEVIMQLKADSDDFVFKQYDGTEVFRVEDNGDFDIAGGYGSSGVTVTSAGAITTDSILTADGGAKLGDADTDSVGVTGSFSIYNVNVGQDFLSYQADQDYAIINGSQIFLQPYTKLQLGLAGAEIVAVAQMTASNGLLASNGLVVGAHLLPSGDDAVSLGSSDLQFRDLHLDGTANIDSLVADTADINGGNIDGTTIGATSQAAGSFTSLDASGDMTAATITMTGFEVDAVGDTALKSLAVDNSSTVGCDADTDIMTLANQSLALANDVDFNVAKAGGLQIAGTAVTATAVELNYLDITTLGTAAASKALTIKGDSTWTVAGMTCADLGAVTTMDLNGGSIDGTVIGANSAAAGTFTTVNASSTMTATEFIATSDARLKSNIQGVTNAMDVINHLQGVEYDLNETGQHSMGVLAQDLIEVAPSLVKTRENGNYAVNYSGLSAFFVEAIKEQQAQIEDLKNTVKELSK